MIDLAATGKHIKELCNARGIRPDMLAKEMGFASVTAIYKWFEGGSLPQVDNLFILADIFGITVDELIVRRNVK
jgi:transcriptional regulator with XRE-family HTH domain